MPDRGCAHLIKTRVLALKTCCMMEQRINGARYHALVKHGLRHLNVECARRARAYTYLGPAFAKSRTARWVSLVCAFIHHELSIRTALCWVASKTIASLSPVPRFNSVVLTSRSAHVHWIAHSSTDAASRPTTRRRQALDLSLAIKSPSSSQTARVPTTVERGLLPATALCWERMTTSRFRGHLVMLSA